MTRATVWKLFAAVMAAMMIVAMGAGVITPGWVDAATLEVGPGKTYATIQDAISVAVSGDTITVAAGLYTEVGQIVINKNLSIVGADKATTIIKPNASTTNSGDGKGWWLVNQGITFNLSGVTLDGTGKMIFHGIRHKGTGTIQNVHFTNLQYNSSGSDYAGWGIYAFVGPAGTGAVNVSDCQFDNIGRVGITYWGAGTTGTYARNTYTGKGLGNWLDYAVEVTNGAVVTIADSTITNCRGTATLDSSTSAGIIVLLTGSKATITNNTITGNYWGINVNYATGTATPEAYANGNNISGNYDLGARHGSAYGVFDAPNNWWGSNTGPGPVGPGTGDKVSTNVTYSPWTLRNLPIQVTSPAGAITVASSAGTLDLATDTPVNDFSTEGLLPLAEMPYGVVSFTVSNLTPGATVTMTFTLPTVPPTDLEFWKYVHGAWVDCSSLLGGVDDGNNTVFVTIRDGGLGDSDGLANGVIVDPGAFVIPNLFKLLGLLSTASRGSSVSPVAPAPPVSQPNILVQSASLSAKAVTPGTPVTVTADIANKSTVNGSKKVTLYVNGQVETTLGVAVNSGSSSQLKFNVSRITPGDYTVYVDGVPAGRFKVQMVTGNLALFIVVAVLIGLTFVFGLFMLWRRQRTGYS